MFFGVVAKEEQRRPAGVEKETAAAVTAAGTPPSGTGVTDAWPTNTRHMDLCYKSTVILYRSYCSTSLQLQSNTVKQQQCSVEQRGNQI